MIFIKVFRDYLSIERQASEHTITAYVKDVSDFQAFFQKQNIQITEIASYQLIREWLIYLVKKGLINRSINRKVASVKLYYKFLIRIGEVSINPFEKHRALKVDKKVQIPFSQKEMSKVLNKSLFSKDFVGVRDKLVLELLYATGLRRSELVNIKHTDLDINKKEIKVLGKGNKQRIVPITEVCAKCIEFYIKVKEKEFLSDVNSYLIVNTKGERIKPHTVYSIVVKYMRLCVTKKKVSPHMIRHTVATHLLDNEANLNEVKELLGHTTIASTQTYTNSSLAELKKQYLKAHPRSKKYL